VNLKFQFEKILILILMICICEYFGYTNLASSQRHVIITYDISQSMYYLKSKNDKISFLTAGQFKLLSNEVIDLVFHGNAFKNSYDVIVTNPNNSGPYWRKNDGFSYIEYGGREIVKINYEVGEKSSNKSIISQLKETIAYPRDIPGNSNLLTKSEVNSAFTKAFPELASLQILSEIRAWETFDKMIKSGDKNAEVFWIRVSDEDRDHTTTITGPVYDKEEKNLEIRRQNYIQKYKNCMPIPRYQIKYANRIWVTTFLLKYVDLNKLQISLKDAKKEEKKLKEELGKLRIKSDKDMNLYKIDLEKVKREANNASLQVQELTQKLEIAKKEKDKAIKEAQQTIDAAKNTLKTAVKDLHLNIIGNNRDITSLDIKFFRKRIKEIANIKVKPFVFDKFIFQNGNQSIASDFKISNLNFRIVDRHGKTIKNKDDIRIIPDQLTIGQPFTLSVPYEENLIKNAKFLYAEVSYLFQNDNKTYTKNWNLKVNFAGGNIFGWLFFLFFIFIAVVIVIFIISIHSKKKENIQEEPDSDEYNSNLRDSDTEEHSIFEREDQNDYDQQQIRGDFDIFSSSKTEILFKIKGIGEKNIFVENNATIYLSEQQGRDIDKSFLNIDSSETLKWENGILYHNGNPVKGNTIKVRDNNGRKIKITYKIN